MKTFLDFVIHKYLANFSFRFPIPPIEHSVFSFKEDYVYMMDMVELEGTI